MSGNRNNLINQATIENLVPLIQELTVQTNKETNNTNFDNEISLMGHTEFKGSTIDKNIVRKIYDSIMKGDQQTAMGYDKSNEIEFRIALIILAKHKEVEAIGFVRSISSDVSPEDSILGYAWGGHSEIIDKYYSAYPIHFRIRGYFYGKHIDKLSEISENRPSWVTTQALWDLEDVGYFNKIEDVLEILALSKSKKLSNCVLGSYEKVDPSCDESSLMNYGKLIQCKMEQEKISYEEFKNNYLSEWDRKNSHLVQNEKLLKLFSIFSDSSEKLLTGVQKLTLSLLEQHGLKAFDLFNWKPWKNKAFTTSHKTALSYLIREKNVLPKTAIAEISQLQEHEALALFQLYDSGVRGEHFRKCQEKLEKEIYFTSELCDQLVEKIMVNKMDIQEALNETYQSGSSLKQLTRLSYGVDLMD